MNDSSEHKFGLAVLNETFEELRNEKSGRLRNEIDELRKFIQEGILGGNPKYRSRYFASCVSRSEDSLGQWRGYANGGFCIEFSEDLLKRSVMQGISADSERATSASSFSQSDFGVVTPLLDVMYTASTGGTRNEQIAHRVREICDRYAKDCAVESLDDDIYSSAQLGLAIEYGHQLFPLTLITKDDAFKEESEVRIVVSPRSSSSVKFRPSEKFGPVPFVSIRIDTSAIRSIWVGPGPNRDVREAGAEELATRYLLSSDQEIPIKVTSIPYR